MTFWKSLASKILGGGRGVEIVVGISRAQKEL